ncbi:MAG: LysR family transcriptional regulator [Cyanobacteria bacterium P01_D01_bin.44]
MDSWNEIRTAYQVARLGTVSAAAEYLGVHRATVIRHIDALESVLGEKVFQRHSRGYTPTEVGLDLMRVAKTTDEQFSQLVGRTKGRATELSGEFVVTSLYVVTPMLMPVLNAFQTQHPNIIVRYMVSDRIFRLEYGEAHVAIRTGPQPDQSDNVVQPFTQLKIGLYASADYVSHHGIPQTLDDFANHRFVGYANPSFRERFNLWLRKHVREENIVFQSNTALLLDQAIVSGAGIGFMAAFRDSKYSDLIEIWPHQDEWDISFWLVTHIDLHHTAKVQTFLKFLKDKANKLNL